MVSKPQVASAGLDTDVATPHTLHHTVVTHLVQVGVNFAGKVHLFLGSMKANERMCIAIVFYDLTQKE